MSEVMGLWLLALTLSALLRVETGLQLGCNCLKIGRHGVCERVEGEMVCGGVEEVRVGVFAGTFLCCLPWAVNTKLGRLRRPPTRCCLRLLGEGSPASKGPVQRDERSDSDST